MNPVPSDDFKERVLRAAAQTPSLTRLGAWSRAFGFSILAAIPMLALLFYAGGPRHAAARPLAVTIATTIGCLMISMVATWVVSSRTQWMTGASREASWFVALGLPILYAAWIAAFHGHYEPPFERLGIRCFILTLTAAPWPFVAMVTWRKMVEPHHPRVLGAAFGAAAGMWAGLTVVLFCPLSEFGHVARGHLLPFVVLIAAGSLLGAWFFAVKSV
jgi:hypothetical protein